MVDHVGKITNPQGMVLIWNYRDRITTDGAKDPNDVEQVIINSASLKSISTSKSKSRPEGSFEIRLAPTFNWVARITPGSWCTILMTKDEFFLPQNNNALVPLNTPNTVKMIGRIHSVRSVVGVDQNTGTRITEYIVSGEDWGSVFNTNLYIDPVAAQSIDPQNKSPIGHAAFLLFGSTLKSMTEKGDKPTSTGVIEAIIRLWGDPLPEISKAISTLSPKLALTSNSHFQLPKEMMVYLNQNTVNNKVLPNFAHLITLKHGTLKGKDKYPEEDEQESFGMPEATSFVGVNSFWQLLTSNCNPTINELVAELRWNEFAGLAAPEFTLYKRIKPFITRDTNGVEGFKEPAVKKNISKFQNLQSTDIPLEDVMSINAGTNWRDKINFVEVYPKIPDLPNGKGSGDPGGLVKSEAQTFDDKAMQRDGFIPLQQRPYYAVYEGGKPQYLQVTTWKHLLREWYFNTHTMLNGSMTIIGQNKYIAVGSNVRIPIRALGDNFFNAGQLSGGGSLLGGNEPKVFLLAHVENINHSFTVDEQGARQFKSTIQFSRGIVVDDSGKVLAEDSSGTLDQDAGSLSPEAKEKNANVFGTSTVNDPDIEKLNGR
jgi:hypothetical protein